MQALNKFAKELRPGSTKTKISWPVFSSTSK